MSENTYTPPKVWSWDKENGGEWASLNRPDSGSRFEQSLPVGEHPFQLYSLATPNGVKATVMFEELLAAGEAGAEYDAHLIKIQDADQFSSGFVDINPNSKIPALVDKSGTNNVNVFESGAILLHLAEKFGRFIPSSPNDKAACLSWLFWQVGSGPYLGGGFGHFYAYAPENFEYPIDRFTMETKRQLDVLDKHLANNDYMAGKEYSIADIAIWPWYGALVLGELYDAAEFLDVKSYTHLVAWAEKIAQRPAVKRGKVVNKTWGDESQQVHERHSKTDFDNIKL
ncbi:glutathione-dependent disulfide-bond oxidoreductase [Psychrosphaera haliotis]|uniref:glutathione-dependent disulfide-bond oxidoreductase n=1 Tax=Psychrosphaera haliotis TaxID=555083 RepID=UPI0031DD1DDB